MLEINLSVFISFFLHRNTEITAIPKGLSQFGSDNDGYSFITKDKIGSLKSSSQRRYQNNIDLFELGIRFCILALFDSHSWQLGINVFWVVHYIGTVSVLHFTLIEFWTGVPEAKDIFFVFFICLHPSMLIGFLNSFKVIFLHIFFERESKKH